MRRRTILSMLCLESRETPSDISVIDPVGTSTPAAATTTATTTSDPVADAAAAAAAIINGMTGSGTTDTNGIYNVPIVP